jgi:hypothetical protein
MNPLTLMKANIVTCLQREAKLSPEDRKQMQWQFLTTIGDLTYIVGKGGANTMFYMVGDAPRVICTPKEMVGVMDAWIGSKFSHYVICDSKKKVFSKPTSDVNRILKKADPVKYASNFIAGVTNDGKLIRLYEAKKGLTKASWVEFKKKK